MKRFPLICNGSWGQLFLIDHCVLRTSELSVVYQKTVTSWQAHLSSSQLATAPNVLPVHRLRSTTIRRVPIYSY